MKPQHRSLDETYHTSKLIGSIYVFQRLKKRRAGNINFSKKGELVCSVNLIYDHGLLKLLCVLGSSVGQVWNYVSINANSTVSSERIWSKYRLSSDLSFYFYALFLFIKEVSLVYFSPIDAIGNLSNITQDCQPTYWTDSYLLGHC